MIAHSIIVSFCIFIILKYDSIFGKKLEHDTYGVNKAGGSVTGLVPVIYVCFFFCHKKRKLQRKLYLKLEHDIFGVI